MILPLVLPVSHEAVFLWPPSWGYGPACLSSPRGFSTWLVWASSHAGFEAMFQHVSNTWFKWLECQESLPPGGLLCTVAGPLYMVAEDYKRTKTEAAKFLNISALKPRPTTSSVSILLHLLFKEGDKARRKGEENRDHFLMGRVARICGPL